MSVCLYCRFWADGRRSSGNITTGDCRRYPPTVLPSREFSPAVNTVWPRVHGIWRCGEFADHPLKR